MRISSISTSAANPAFNANKNSSSKNKIRNAAGAAAIALVSISPSVESEAQIPIYPQYNTVTVAPQKLKVPTCFLVGDTRNSNTLKSREDIFNEIDANGNGDGLLTENEVVKTDILNWNLNNPMKYNVYQLQQTKERFYNASEMYNEEDSNPMSININEFNEIMDDFDAENPKNMLPALPIIPAYPSYYYIPPYHHYHDRYDHHHHHHHRH